MDSDEARTNCVMAKGMLIMLFAAILLFAGCGFHAKDSSSQADPSERVEEILAERKVSGKALRNMLEEEGYGEPGISHALENIDFRDIAVQRAKDILVDIAASPARLGEMLALEGFAEDEALYGVEHCDADWSQMAGIEAANLLLEKDLTLSQLIDALQEKGFSLSEAEFGAELYYGK